MSPQDLLRPASVALPADATPDPRRWKALCLLAIAEFMVVLDASIVNIALPDIGKGLHFATSSLAWIITAYLVAFAGLLPLGGRFADLLRRRRMFIAGISVFSLASLAAGLAPTAAALVAARAVQGMGAALLAPAALSLVTSIFPEGSERTKAFGIWGAVAAGGGAAGVLLGGLLTGGLGWRSIFLINVPVGIAVLLVVRALVSENNGENAGRLSVRRFDIAGAVAVTGGLVLLVIALSQATAWGWASPATLATLASAAVLLVLFVGIELRGRYPLVPMLLLRVRTVAAGNGIMILTGAAMLGLFYFLSLYEQVILGYSAITAGLSQLPLALSLIAAAAGVAPLMKRFGARIPLAAGMAILSGGLAWFGLAPVNGTFAGDILGPSLLVGIGLGMVFVPLTAVAVAGVPAASAGVASGLVNTTQEIGSVLGLAALATLANSRTNAIAHLGPMADALNSGYAWAFRGAALIAAVALIVVVITVRKGDGAGPDAADATALAPALSKAGNERR
jgi:EmrB/QacA subfamily drug resistance transporter